jgi:hypothetical protein
MSLNGFVIFRRVHNNISRLRRNITNVLDFCITLNGFVILTRVRNNISRLHRNITNVLWSYIAVRLRILITNGFVILRRISNKIFRLCKYFIHVLWNYIAVRSKILIHSRHGEKKLTVKLNYEVEKNTTTRVLLVCTEEYKI